MSRITVNLHTDEQKALQSLAQVERRHPRQQAAILIRRELERRGLLPEPKQTVAAVAGREVDREQE
jgi:hypothetical protein